MQNKIVVLGNSGSGKSTYASKAAKELNCTHLDLDTIAWTHNANPPKRLPLIESTRKINSFMKTNINWVIEGCYADLLSLALPFATELVFLNPGTETCISNAKNRPWESHKYDSLEQQNKNLPMLIEWIMQYDQRNDEFSLQSHRRLFENFEGRKQELTSNKRDV